MAAWRAGFGLQVAGWARLAGMKTPGYCCWIQAVGFGLGWFAGSTAVHKGKHSRRATRRKAGRFDGFDSCCSMFQGKGRRAGMARGHDICPGKAAGL